MNSIQVMQHADLIRSMAAKFELDPCVLAGLVEQESGGDPWAIRFEKGYRWLWGDDSHEKLKRPPTESQATEWIAQKTSYGLGQIMGATAREMGFGGWLTRLCEPRTGLLYAARYLAWCIKRRKGDIRAGLLRYNGGANWAYADEVMQKAKKYQGAI